MVEDHKPDHIHTGQTTVLSELSVILVGDRPNPIHPEDKPQPQEDELLSLQQSNWNTYFLITDQNHKRVSSEACNKQIRAHTP